MSDLPGSDRLEEAIRTAYRDLPHPDARRLEEICRGVELSSPARRPAWRSRWLPWVLLAGTAAVAAGVGEYVAWREAKEAVNAGVEAVDPPAASTAPGPATTPSAPAREAPPGGSGERRERAAVIYRQ